MNVLPSISLLGLCCISLAAAGEFPTPYNSEPDTSSSPMPAAEAAAAFKVPPGFKVTAFAAEPDVQNPIAMTWDARGRLWVVENYTYAERAKHFDLNLRDRVVIFEDANKDGNFSSRKVFTDEIQMATGIEVGRDGVWLTCPPRLLFIPDRNGDDLPDAAPQVVLDGFTVPEENYHGFVNGLRFGPDGWLYGRCGGAAPGEVGMPGTPAEQRVPVRGSIWRYHPQRKVFESLTSGTTNPWGHDWDENGELFFINTVNGHLWHGITGAHYVRAHSIDPNPHAYGLIDQHADHWHFDTSQDWTKSRDGAANDFGGGHAHVGMMIYQGDNWPEEYRGKLFTWNLHGRRANQEILTRSGSGYVGSHGADLLLAGDPWFRGMELSTGPDGGVFALDWSDTGECHDSTGVHRTSGRIFKITHGEPARADPVDLKNLSASALVKLHTHANDWWVRQARLELTDRAAAEDEQKEAIASLGEMAAHDANPVRQLRALWTLYAMGATDDGLLLVLLGHANEHVRVWAVRLLTDAWPLDTGMSQRPGGRKDFQPSAEVFAALAGVARDDTSGLVRLALASTLQRLPVARRADLATPLVAHAEDANDHNLPLMIWYGIIPLADSDPAALVKLAAACELPVTRQFIARRLAEDIGKNPAPLNALLEMTATKPEAFQADILTGVAAGLGGWSKAGKPAAWDTLAAGFAKAADSNLRDRARDLGVLFGDGRALDEAKRVVLDKSADPAARETALLTLIGNRPPDLRQICESLLDTDALAAVAVRGLAQFDDPGIGEKLAARYRGFSAAVRSAVIDTLVSRPASAKFLLARMAAGEIAPSDVTPFHARQIRGFNDAALTRQLTEAWGELRDSTAGKQQLIARLKAQLTPEVLAKADMSQGRVLFTTVCAACHTLYGTGGTIGPDLTGSGRDNLDYLLDNVVDPSAVVNADFRMTVVKLNDGRVLNGFIAAKTERTLTLKTMTESMVLERTAIASLQESKLSIMPEGLLDAWNATQVRDLTAYLMGRNQVPLPEEGK